MHIHQLPSGNWHVIVQANGIRRAATAPTRAAAQRKGAHLIRSIDGPHRPGERVTLGEMLAHHLAAVAPRLSPTTLAEYERIVERIPDDIGDRLVDAITARDVDGWYRRLFSDGWAVGAVRRLHELLHAAWKQTAIFHGWADHNPVSSVRKPARAPHRINPPEPETVRRLLAAADEQFRLYLRLAATTGARRGELVALRWSDVDLERAEALIHRSLVYTPASGITERGTKTGGKGHRRIALDDGTAAALSAHYVATVDLATANLLPTPVYVFSYDAGVTPWHPDTPTGMFTRLRDRVGASEVRLHDLRHYVATRMLSHGESVAQTAARLGHADIATTMRTYAHWLPARDREAVAGLAAELDD